MARDRSEAGVGKASEPTGPSSVPLATINCVKVKQNIALRWWIGLASTWVSWSLLSQSTTRLLYSLRHSTPFKQINHFNFVCFRLSVAMLGFCCSSQPCFSCSKQGLFFSRRVQASHCSAFSWSQGTRASVGAAHGLQSVGAAAVTQGLAAQQHVASSWTREWTCVSWIASGFFTTEPPEKPF